MAVKNIVAILGLAIPMVAQTAPAPKTTPIDPELRAEYYKSQIDVMTINQQLQAANTTFSAIRDKVIKACDGQPIIADENGQPACQAKVETKPTKAPEKK